MSRRAPPPDLLDRARREGNPVVDTNSATFVWRGKTAPALEGDFTSWDPAKAVTLEPAGPGLWFHRLSLRPDTYIEYAFTSGIERHVDPLNKHRMTWNGIEAYNHYFHMPQAVRSELATPVDGVPRGTVTRHVAALAPWDESREPRIVRLYRPPVRGRVPLLVVYDGRDYFKRTKLTTIADNLIAQRRVRPFAIAFVPTFTATRVVEYGCADITLAWVLDTIVPLAQAELELVDNRTTPGSFGVLGASMGGLMALYTAVRKPDVFGRVVAQSSSLNYGGQDYVLWDLIRSARKLPRIWLGTGRHELPDILEDNRRLDALLRARRAKHVYCELSSGHNFPSWGNEVWRGLEAAFGPA